MKVVIGIPARMGASRFPGKPLCSILGKPMIEHVYKRSALSTKQNIVFVAACDDVIKKTVESFGGNVIMTPPEIERPALRVVEACRSLDLQAKDIVAVVQGDEPLIHPDMIDLGIETLMNNPDVLCTNLATDISDEELTDPNEVKVVTDIRNNALYMSRSPIPSNTRNRKIKNLKQLGIFFFFYESMLRFQSMEPTPLEVVESIEMLRPIQHGEKVRMVYSPFISKGVDTESDRQVVEKILPNDPIWSLYAKK